jgi:uncharacterized protein (DUF427 family)
MNAKLMKLPGPDHPISISLEKSRVRVSLSGRVIAETQAALGLSEASYPLVLYIPRKDADMSQLERTAHSTFCPYKGECSYFSIPLGGDRSINAVWSYEQPYPSVMQIQDHLAFYASRVDSIERFDSDQHS